MFMLGMITGILGLSIAVVGIGRLKKGSLLVNSDWKEAHYLIRQEKALGFYKPGSTPLPPLPLETIHG